MLYLGSFYFQFNVNVMHSYTVSHVKQYTVRVTSNQNLNLNISGTNKDDISYFDSLIWGFILRFSIVNAKNHNDLLFKLEN